MSTSPSTPFFSSGCRSPRGLASLAARVHSPSPSKSSKEEDGFGSLNDIASKDQASSHVEQQSAGLMSSEWELPTLNFRPLSFVGTSAIPGERPRSAEGFSPVKPITILSPTPERPLSSQSRKRFSKILSIQDDHARSNQHQQRFHQPFHSINFVKLKQVEEIPEIPQLPQRFSIPPFLAPTGKVSSSTESDRPSGQSSRDAGSTPNTNHEKSTIESLLDRHIECLGLKPEFKLVQKSSDGGTFDSVADESKDSTPRLSDFQAGKKSQSTNNAIVTSRTTNSLDSSSLVPKRLFANEIERCGNLPSALSVPCVSHASETSHSKSRPSTGWMTLASSSGLTSLSLKDQPTHLMRLGSGPSSSQIVIDEKRLSTKSASPSGSSEWSGNTADLYDWNDDASVQKKLRSTLTARQMSQRRKMRLRLKLRRDSLSQGKLSQASSAQASFHTARIISPTSAKDLQDDKTTLDSKPALAVPTTILDHLIAAETGLQERATSPEIPKRQSSNFTPAEIRSIPTIARPRKLSMNTIRSHRSNMSIVEPINTSRQSLVAPRLELPDVGPPLIMPDLNMDHKYPEMSGSRRPLLREARSFFSDDSSNLHDYAASIRRRFNFANLKNVIPLTPRRAASTHAPHHIVESGQSKSQHSCQTIPLEMNTPGKGDASIAGVSEFSHRRRKMISKIKEWLKLHGVTRRRSMWKNEVVTHRMGSEREESKRRFGISKSQPFVS